MDIKQNLDCHVDDMRAFDQHHYDEDESDSEVALDLRGRKHVEQIENSDGVYWLQDNTRSSYVVFPVPGRASVDALRKFLGEKLPYNLITDEYGRVATLAEISDDHLPTLQAQLWLKGSSGSAKTALQLDIQVQDRGPAVQQAPYTTSSSAVRALREQEGILMACHVIFIAELLESNHIFVLRNNADRACEFPQCRLRSDDQPLPSAHLTIEPLVHWATVTPAANFQLCGGSIQAFRRNGEKCGDPLWSQAVKKIVPHYPASYCSTCLGMLIDNRTNAWAGLKRRKTASFTAINRPTPALHVKSPKIDHGFKGSDGDRFTLKRGTSTSNAIARPDGYLSPYSGPTDQDMAASLSLDGACDAPPTRDHTRRSHTSLLNPNVLAGQEHSDELNSPLCESSISATQTSPLVQTLFTQASEMNSGVDTSHGRRTATSAWTTTNQTPSLPSSPLPNQLLNADNQITSEPERTISPEISVEKFTVNHNTINSFTPIQKTKRKFGRELDANAILRAPKKAMSTAPNTKIPKKGSFGTADTCDFLHSAPTTSPHGEARDPSPMSRSRDRSPSWETTIEALDVPDENEPLLATPKVSPIPKIKALPKKKAPPVPKPDKSLHSKAGTKPPVPLFFAKRIPIAAPDTISEHIYAKYQTRQPSAKEVICSCSKPARTNDVMIAQCFNADCVIGWYHYACLDKSEKISCRHGRWTCQHCKNETHFKDLEKQNGWSIEKMLKSEVKLPFTGQEILAAMPNLGGQMGIVNPYGFGDAQEQDVAMFTPMPGALGSLAFFGYAESSPHAVKTAYAAPRAYVDRRDVDREYEGYEDDEDYYYDDKYEYDYEEVYGDEGEERVEEEIDVE